MQCVILAGGIGTRMKSYTDQIPKALIPVAGKPFLSYQLDYLATQGVKEVLLSIGYKGEMIRDHIDRNPPKGLQVNWVDEGKELRGTGGALRLALEQGKLQSHFYILYGDSFVPIDFRPVARRFEEGPEQALMTVVKNEGQWDESNACFDGRRITLYQKGLGAKKPPEMRYIDYGLSMLRREVVEREIPSGQKSDLAEVFHRLSRQGALAGFEVHSRFFEIGSPQGLADFVNYSAEK
jgi:NDP-sugar pyrophosphorylase family protein